MLLHKFGYLSTSSWLPSYHPYQASVVRCTPRVRPLHGGQWHDLHTATLAVRAGFKPQPEP